MVKETNIKSESSAELHQTLDTSAMEATHQVFSELLENMAHADNDVFPARFQTLLALTRLHIVEEGWLMRAYVKDGLTPWFDLHLATMDAALETHLRRQAG